MAGYEAPPRKPGRLAPATGSLMGTHSADSTQMEAEEQGIVHLEEALGRKMDINNHYHGGWEDIAEDGLSWLEYWDVENGRIPLVGWGCHDSNKIISGAEDDIIRRTAQQMKAFGHEFFMRYCWEMDGSRKQGTVKGPKQFVAAWQRMYRIFQEEGATNVIWTWTANAAGFKDKRKYSNNEPPGPYFYPGDEYVDWVAADGYNWGVSKRNQGDRWRQVLEIFDEFMIFARTTSKPIMIGEYGAQEQKEDPEAKPEWMRLAHDVLINKPKTPDCKHCGAFSDVAAVVYFDVDYGAHGDWRIMSSTGDPRRLQGGVGRSLVPPDGNGLVATPVNQSNPKGPTPVRPGLEARKVGRVDSAGGAHRPGARAAAGAAVRPGGPGRPGLPLPGPDEPAGRPAEPVRPRASRARPASPTRPAHRIRRTADQGQDAAREASRPRARTSPRGPARAKRRADLPLAAASRPSAPPPVGTHPALIR